MGRAPRKRSDIPAKYRWNMEDMIPSGEELSRLLSEAERGVASYGTYAGTLGESAERLWEFLHFSEGVDEILSRLFAYAQQKSDEDTSDGRCQSLLGQVQTLVTRQMAAASFAEPEILAIPEERMEGFLQSETLSLYRKQLARLLAKREHTLSKREEELLALSLDATQGAAAAYKLFNNANLKFPEIVGEDGEPAPVTHGSYQALLESRDRRVRRDAFCACYSGYRQFSDTVAALFEANVKQACFYAKARNYPSSRAYYLAENEIPERVYDNLVSAVNRRLPLLHRYAAIRRRMLGVEELHMYDMYVPLVPEFDRKIPYDEAKRLIPESLAPLGEEYVNTVKEGFESRWIDVYENEGKRSGGYSNCVYGVHPYVLISYSDTLSSAMTVAHEMGHSMHSWYSNGNQPYAYADYKIFVAEVASTCNEILFLRCMMDRAGSEEERRAYTNERLERFRGTMFRQTMFAEFEMNAHRMAEEGVPLTKDALCKMYHELNEKYFGEAVVVDPEIDFEWERIPHFYRPFYVYQYATGFAAATAIAGRILAGDRGTLDGYFRFLKGGSSMSPIELLKLCGVDMERPQAVDEALDIFAGLLDEFEK